MEVGKSRAEQQGSGEDREQRRYISHELISSVLISQNRKICIFLNNNAEYCLVNVSSSCWKVVAKSNAQNERGILTSVPRRTSTGGWVTIGDVLPKNMYVYLFKRKWHDLLTISRFHVLHFHVGNPGDEKLENEFWKKLRVCVGGKETLDGLDGCGRWRHKVSVAWWRIGLKIERSPVQVPSKTNFSLIYQLSQLRSKAASESALKQSI